MAGVFTDNFSAACEQFCSKHPNYGSVASKARSAIGGVAVTRGQLEARLDRMLQRLLSLDPESTVCQSSVTGARCPVSFPELPRSGGDQLASGTGHPSHGRHTQGMGR
jgi:hypothetical protein